MRWIVACPTITRLLLLGPLLLTRRDFVSSSREGIIMNGTHKYKVYVSTRRLQAIPQLFGADDDTRM
jgi:hypothetical protein